MSSPVFRLLLGGALTRVFALDAQRAWVSEDGGRLRHTNDGGNSWTFQATPDSARGMLHSVFFLADGLTGWAVSDDGLVLATDSGGAQGWMQRNAQPIEDPTRPGARATLFDVHFADEQRGWLAGLHLLKRTTDGGETWSDVQLVDANGNPLDMRDFEAYALAFCFSGGNLLGLASAEPGLVLRSVDPNGARWTAVLEIDDPQSLQPPCNSDAELEVWYVTFVPGTPFAQARAYVVSGLANGCGYHFTSKDGGQTWQQDGFLSGGPGSYPRSFATYGVSAYRDGGAIATGYGSQVLVREPGQDVWVDASDRHALGTQPLLSVACDPASQQGTIAFAVGEFGALRRSKTRGKTWADLVFAPPWRLRSIAFPPAPAPQGRGWVAGQQLRIAITRDGGQSWTEQRAEPLGSPDFGRTLRSIALADASNGVAVGGVSSATNRPTIFFSLDADSDGSWQQAQLPPTVPGFELRRVACAGSRGQQNVFWAVGPGGLALRSLDGGATWTVIPVNVAGQALPPNLNGIGFLDLANGFAVGANADGSAAALRIAGADGPAPTWTNVSPGGGAELFAVAVATQSRTIFAVGKGGSVWRMRSMDAAFAPVAEAQALVPAGTDLFDVASLPGAPQPQMFACGTRGFVLQLEAGAWSTPRSQTSLALLGVALPDGAHGYAVGGLTEGTSIVVGFSG